MKKIFFYLLALLICQSNASLLTAQTSVTQPEAGKSYNIVHGTGLFLSRNINSEVPLIENPTGYYDQIFEFEPVPEEAGTYYIKNMYDDDYLVLGEANVWSMTWVKNPATIPVLAKAKYQISILEATTTYIQIKNLGSAMLGTDHTSAGSEVYADKNGLTNSNYQWIIKEYSDEVDKTALSNKLTEAITLYEATSAGSGSDQYPESSRNALKYTIDEAQEIFDDPQADQADVNEILLDLSAALEAYIDSVNPFLPDTSASYYIGHSNGLFFGTNLQVSAGTYAADQQFKFVAVQGQNGIYNIQSISSNEYLTRSPDNAWDILWAPDPAIERTQFEIKSVGGGLYRIRCIGLSGAATAEESYLGIDPWATGVYVNKNGKDISHHWRITDITTIGLVTTALEEALAKVTEFLQYAVRGTGSDQYPPQQYDALTAAKTAAETLLANIGSATQDQVGTATLALNNALAAAIAAVNPFLPDANKTYNIIHYGGLYLGDYPASNSIAIFHQTQENDQLVKFTAVSGKSGVSNIQFLSLPDKYLTRSSEPHLDGSGNPEPGKYDDYKLIWGDDAATEFAQFEIKKNGIANYYGIRCITVGPQRPDSYIGTDDANEYAVASVDKTGAGTNHYWRLIESTDTGISKAANTDVRIYSANKQLTINGLKGNSRVFVYTLAGRLISTSEITGAIYNKELPVGNYIIVVNGASLYRGIVAVR
jgi:hypothetical protein